MKMTGESWVKNELFSELRLFDGFQNIKASRAFDKHKPKTCWHFKKEKINEPEKPDISKYKKDTLQNYKPLDAV